MRAESGVSDRSSGAAGAGFGLAGWTVSAPSYARIMYLAPLL